MGRGPGVWEAEGFSWAALCAGIALPAWAAPVPGGFVDAGGRQPWFGFVVVRAGSCLWSMRGNLLLTLLVGIARGAYRDVFWSGAMVSCMFGPVLYAYHFPLPAFSFLLSIFSFLLSCRRHQQCTVAQRTAGRRRGGRGGWRRWCGGGFPQRGGSPAAAGDRDGARGTVAPRRGRRARGGPTGPGRQRVPPPDQLVVPRVLCAQLRVGVQRGHMRTFLFFSSVVFVFFAAVGETRP